jgi:hypothetical protein
MRQPSGPSSSLTLTLAPGLKGGVREREGVGGSTGGGGVSSMNQSWCAMRNSSTSWLSRCSLGESSCVGCDINPGRKITARSVKQRLNKEEERRGKMYTLRSHQVLVCFAGKDGEEIEDVEKKILTCVRHRMDEFLVRRDDHVLIVWRFRYHRSSAARPK